MRCTQLLDGDGATEVVPLLVGLAVEEDDRGEVNVVVLLGIRDVEVAEVVVGADDAVPPLCVLPPEEHPVRTNPEATQALTAHTNWREAGTARR